MDLVTLAVAQKYTRDKIAEAAVGGVDVTEYVNERVDTLINGASGTFDTLGEIETAVGNKVDKVSGKGLSTNDFTNAYKTKLDSALTSYTETDPTVPAWAKATNKPTYTASEVGAVPTTRTVNGKALSGNITLSATDVGALPSTTTLFSGDYNDLTNKPTIPSTTGLASETYVNNAVSGKADTNTLAKVATSGSYNDLDDKPVIPSVEGLASETYVDNKIATMGLILNSSTEGSTKKFKITVDDAGVLTAAEVTE